MKRQFAIAAPLLVALILLTACNPVRELNKGAYRAQAVIHQIAPALVDMQAQGRISLTQERDLAAAARDLNDSNQQFIALLSPPPGEKDVKWTKELRNHVIAKIAEITQRLQILNNIGTLHIKNEASRQIFDGLMLSLRTILAALPAL